MNNSFQEICTAIHRFSSTEDVEAFLREVFTEKELRDLELRWELMKKLKAGESQRSIARELHISLCKITRGAKILKQVDSVSNRILSTKDSS